MNLDRLTRRRLGVNIAVEKLLVIVICEKFPLKCPSENNGEEEKYDKSKEDIVRFNIYMQMFLFRLYFLILVFIDRHGQNTWSKISRIDKMQNHQE